ncbi:IS66 family insertion sequence element accessory protein TnpB, partial [Acidithiobacillus sp. VAN18-4]|nr:IS66 family insertion sequence element accessory protein TnpB [Acidithiobacillus sp. VAN18-4]
KEEKRELWRARVEDFRGSGLTVGAYCAREGIAVATLQYWRRRFVDAVEPRPMVHGTEGFLPVTLAPVRLPVSPVEIHLLSGRSLKLTAPLDTGWLQTLVRVLESPCG